MGFTLIMYFGCSCYRRCAELYVFTINIYIRRICIIMDVSGLFPHLSNTYYKDLGRTRGMITDTYSGLIVQFTLLAIV